MTALRKRRRAGDPLPDWVEPQLSKLVAEPPAGPDWAHEIKYDGYRMHGWFDRREVRLLTRTGLDWTEKYAGTVEALRKLPARTAYLDGELCALRPDGTSSFSLMQSATDARLASGLVYFVFDLLHLDGEDLMRLPLAERKARLEALLTDAPEGIQYSGHVVGNGEHFHAEACKLELEGILSKRLDAPYAPGNRGLWRKSKCVNREEFVVVGWTDPEGGRPWIGALLLGYYAPDGRLVYAGRAGSGMSDAELGRVWKKLQPYAASKMPVDIPPPRTSRFGTPLVLSRVHWLRPELVAEVTYLTWTDDGLLRQVVYQGLREDKPARQVVRPLPHAPAKTPPAVRAPASAPRKRARGRPSGAVPPENILQLLPDAVVPSPEDLKRYWSRVAPRALEHLAHRPLKLVRHIHNTTFYHMGPLPEIPSAVHQLRMKKAQGGEGVRLWIDSLDGLHGLVDIGAVELHPWGARVDDIERPDRLVLDLDPGVGIEWDFVIDTALGLRDLLQAEGFEPWAKTSGGKGLHIMVPSDRPWSWKQAHDWAKRLAQRYAARDAKRYTTSAALHHRAGRLFIDYLRIGRGTTAVGTWSPRARPHFPIAAPVSWQQVERGIRPDAYTISKLPPARRTIR